ncbi:MAG: O-antigen ligase family protein [Nocardioidaceae bacterium]
MIVAPIVVGPLLMCLRQPMRIALPAYAVLVPFGGLLSIGASRFGSLSSLIGIVLGIGLVLQLVSGRRLEVPLSATVPIWLLFLAVAGATVLWSLTPAKTVNGFVVLGSLVFVYVLVALSHVDRAILTRTENGLLLGGVLATGYGLTQLFFLGGFPNDVPGLPPGPGGRFGNDLLGPNNEAVALLLPLLVSLSRSVTRGERSKRTFHAFVSALLLLGILMTGSRGGILAAVVAVTVLALSNREGRVKLFAYAGVGITVAAAVLFLHPAGLAERQVQTTSSSGRTDIWRVGLAACPQYCPIGSGWETFPDVYAATQPSVPDAAVLVGKGGSYQPHNVWMLVAIELGIPGLILLGAVMWLTLVEALKLPAALRGPPLGGLLGTYFAAMFLSNLEFKFFWMALIMVALSRNLSVLEAPTPVGRGPVAEPRFFTPRGEIGQRP